MFFRLFALAMLFLAIAVFQPACTFIGGSYPGESEGIPVSDSKPVVANQGYDVIAYFAADKAVKGVPQLSLVWNGATYLFSSEENRKKFAVDPAKYVPQFESQCPYSLAHGRTIKGQPTIWRIVGEKLYLFPTDELAKEFEKDPKAVIKKAEETWRKNEKMK